MLVISYALSASDEEDVVMMLDKGPSNEILYGVEVMKMISALLSLVVPEPWNCQTRFPDS
jgi:hypothetical protein